MVDLNNIHTLLEGSEDMPELRKSLCLSLVKELEEKDKEIRDLKDRLDYRWEIKRWFQYNTWPGDLVKNTAQTVVLGSAVILVIVCGIAATIQTVRVSTGGSPVTFNN